MLSHTLRHSFAKKLVYARMPLDQVALVQSRFPSKGKEIMEELVSENVSTTNPA